MARLLRWPSLMPNVSPLSTIPAPLETGSSRLAPQSATSEQPSFADMLGRCVSVPDVENGVGVAIAGDATLLPAPGLPKLSEEIGQPPVMRMLDGEGLPAAEPGTDQEEPSLTEELAPVIVDQPVQLPPLPLAIQTIAATAVANPPAGLQDEPGPIDTAAKDEVLPPGRARPSTLPEPKVEQATETAQPARSGEAANDASGGTAAPSTATDFQQSLMPQPVAPQTSGVQAASPMPAPHPPDAVLPMPSPPTTPMQQVMPVVASVVASHDGAPQTLVIRLDPAELGRVQVHIERTADGLSRISLHAERPDTLQLLVRDQPQLHRALDLAGVPPDGRMLQFQLTPDQPLLPQGSTQFGANGSTGGFAGSNGGGNAGQRSSDRHGGYVPASRASDALPIQSRRLAGVDITA